MKLNIIKLGTIVTDPATGIKGQLITAFYGLNRAIDYALQPSGLNPDKGEPLTPFWVPGAQFLNIAGLPREEVDLPTEILGSQVKHDVTGFKGMAVSLVHHLSGCTHANIQARGTLKNGETIPCQNFDIRQLSGPAIKKLSETVKKADVRKKPSPMQVPPRGRV